MTSSPEASISSLNLSAGILELSATNFTSSPVCLEVGKGLLNAQNQPIHPNGWMVIVATGDKRTLLLQPVERRWNVRRPAQGKRQVSHPYYKLRDCKPRLYISADGVEDSSKSVNVLAFFHSHNLRNDMLVLCGFVLTAGCNALQSAQL